jgi:hypothetical protein
MPGILVLCRYFPISVACYQPQGEYKHEINRRKSQAALLYPAERAIHRTLALTSVEKRSTQAKSYTIHLFAQGAIYNTRSDAIFYTHRTTHQEHHNHRFDTANGLS